MITLQQELDEAFPSSMDSPLIRGVREGVLLADTVLESTSFLKSTVGRDLRGHLRRAGVLHRLHEMAQQGNLPVETTMSKMPRGNWHWIEIKSKRFTAHVCRTDAADAFPDDSPTRQDDRLTNQFELFRDTSTIVPIRGYIAWLTFGVGDSGALAHLCWGMPNAEEDVWLARTNVLRRAAGSEVVVRAETPSKVTTLRFREKVEEALKGQDEGHGEKPA